MLLRVHVEHEVDQRALQLRAEPHVYGEPRSRDLRSSFEIENAQLRSEIPMRFRLERKLSRLAPSPDLDVVLRAFACWHRCVRRIRNASQQFPKLAIKGARAQVEFRNQFIELAHALLPVCRILAGFLQLAD